MTITISTGLQGAIASTYATAVSMTAITNATEAVATLGAGHGVVVGDIIVLNSGWDLANGVPLRAKAVASNDVTLEGFNTSSTSDFPAGAGVGTIQRITAWSSITNLKGITPGGGGLEFADITTLADRTKKEVPTVRAAYKLTLDFFFDVAAAWFGVARAADAAKQPKVLRLVFPDGSRMLANGYWGTPPAPNVATNAALDAQIEFSAIAVPTLYAT